ncbi:MAG: glutamine-hydrolyzing carbamoyl-phosphate synthase small subunit, partial [Chloroflexia bacterium]
RRLAWNGMYAELAWECAMIPCDGLEALLVASDGTVVRGRGAGAPGLVAGELVFQTGMTGYQEALTDPSYAGQILIFTYPLIGNYGVGHTYNQSGRIHARAAIMRDLMSSGGHRDSHTDLDDMLRLQGIQAMWGVDTRFLVRKVRTHGVLPVALAVGTDADLPTEDMLLSMAQGLDYGAIDFVSECTSKELIWHAPASPDGSRIALIDYGAKQSMLDRLLERGAGVWVVPAHASADEILELQPDGIFLANGPGDPARLDYAIAAVRELIRQAGVPIFGICLGHQLLALASGGRTHKMRFGHRGANQPVLERDTGRLYLTTQNHGYVVDADSLPPDYRVTHTNLNDGTMEGLAHVSLPIWSVQWHPEACPGPADSLGLFDRFLTTVDGGRRTGVITNYELRITG